MLRYLLFAHIIGTLCLLCLCAQNFLSFAHSGSDVSAPMAKLEQSVIRDGLDDNEGNKISDAFFQAEAKISENVQKRYWGPEKALMIVFVAGVLTLLSLLMLFAWPPTHPKKPNQESKI